MSARQELARERTRVDARPASRRRSLRRALTGGGTIGNEQLTTATGVVLIVVLAVLGVTILRIGQLISVHLFVGLMLLGPVALKMGATGYRFARYYTRNASYRDKGPPELWLRLLAPPLVVSTLVVFASGVVLLFEGPARRATWLLVHKASFIVWLAVTALHVLGHLPRVSRSLRVARREQMYGGVAAGAAGRWLAIAGVIVGGVVLAIVLIPHYGTWTAPGGFPHHHHD